MEPTVSFSFSLTGVLTLLWLCMLVVYVIFSLIFVYHWRAYATDTTVVHRTLITYFIGSGLAMAVAGVALLSI